MKKKHLKAAFEAGLILYNDIDCKLDYDNFKNWYKTYNKDLLPEEAKMALLKVSSEATRLHNIINETMESLTDKELKKQLSNAEDNYIKLLENTNIKDLTINQITYYLKHIK